MMNERLHDMMMEATKDMPQCYYWPPEYVEKLAELIVEECIEQCWTVSELESNGYVVSECSKKIRKHFGVE